MARPPEAHEDLFIYDDTTDGLDNANSPIEHSSPNNNIIPATTNLLLPNQNNSLIELSSMGEVNMSWGMARMNNHLATMAAALPSLHHFDALQRSFRCA